MTSNQHNHVIIAGSGRSGTTWLMNLINAGGSFLPLFEPLHPRQVPQLSMFGWKRYLPADDRSQEFLTPMRQLFERGITNTWLQQVPPAYPNPDSRLLVKYIRANLLLGWHKHNFPNVKIVYIIRHPIPVALSRIKLGWGANLQLFTSQLQFVEDYLQPYIEYISGIADEFEAEIAAWCIDNLIPFKQLAPEQFHLCYFEELCLNPEETLNNLFAYLELKVTESVRYQLLRPSSMAAGDAVDSIIRGENMALKWRDKVSQEQIMLAYSLLERFGMQHIYHPDGSPNRDGMVSLISSLSPFSTSPK